MSRKLNFTFRKHLLGAITPNLGATQNIFPLKNHLVNVNRSALLKKSLRWLPWLI